MKNRKAQAMCLFMAAAMGMSALYGCTGSGGASSGTGSASSAASAAAQSAQSGGEASNISAAGVLPIVKETVELEFLTQESTSVQNFETNAFTEKTFKETNVKIKWKLVPSMKETKPLLLASGDLPDVFVNGNFTTDEMITYGDNGTLVDLAPYIEQYGKNVPWLFDYNETVRSLLTTPSGKITTLPLYQEAYHMTASSKMFVDTKWLKSLNIKSPTTTQEFHDMLAAFKAKDVNGNGKSDEIALSAKGVSDTISFLMGAFVPGGTNNTLAFAQPYNGTVEITANKPEWREGLRYINQLYKEGLIDTEVFTQDNNLLKQKVGLDSVGAVANYAPSGFSDPNGTTFGDYDAIAPLKGPGGVQTAYYTGNQVIPGYYAVTKACKNPDVAYRFGDYLMGTDVYPEKNNGVKGNSWDDADEGALGINGKPATWKTLPSWNSSDQNEAWGNVGPHVSLGEWRLGEQAAAADKFYTLAGQESRLYQYTTLYEPFYTTKIVPQTLYIASENSKEYADVKTALQEYLNATTAKFITGELSLDNDWDSYLAELNRLGLERYLELSQNAIQK